MDWDHLRYFWALVQAGTLVGAAKALGVEHTTVSRRIQALEKQMGTALFAREAGGHRLSEAGRQLLAAVETMEAAVQGVERLAPWFHRIELAPGLYTKDTSIAGEPVEDLTLLQSPQFSFPTP